MGVVAGQSPDGAAAPSSGATSASPLGPLGQITGQLRDSAEDTAFLAQRAGLNGSQQLQGLPDFVRFQTLGLIIQIQQIPVLDPGYWRYVVGDPWELGRGTREKVRTTPPAMRLAFYGFYQDQLGVLGYDLNPNRFYRQGQNNAWTSSFGALPPAQSQTVLGRFAGTLTGRFAPEELADLVVYGLASSPAAPRERDKWNHYINVAIYNAAWLAGVYFFSQLAQDRAQIRGGRWFTFQERRFALGLFATLSRMGFSFKPQLNADLRLAVRGLETAFTISGAVNRDLDITEASVLGQSLALQHTVRVSWLSYFSQGLGLGWEVYAQGGVRYAVLDATVDSLRRTTAQGSLVARREGPFGWRNTTVGFEGGASTDFTEQLAYAASATMENLVDEVTLGTRATLTTFRSKQTNDWRGTAFVAFALNPPFYNPVLRSYQQEAGLLRYQVAITQREVQRLELMELGGRPEGVLRAQRRAVDEQRRLLRGRLADLEEAREDVARWRRVSTEHVLGFVSLEELEDARELCR